MTLAASFASVWLPVPRRQTFSYRIPENWERIPQPGDLVRVPLGRRQVIGMVESLGVQPPLYIKEVRELIELFPPEYRISPPLLELFCRAIEHYLAIPGEALKTFFPTSLFKGKSRGEQARHRDLVQHFTEDLSLQLNPQQQQAIESVLSSLGKFQPFLLHGVTGSGKTEVYLRLCQEVIKKEQGCLVLIPEIALTPQTVGRFAARFGQVVTSYHSGMTDGQRLKTWWEIQSGEKKIVVGTRSSIFLPVQNLGLIVVDEEHDSSYKQEERFRYHGRDLAVLRAKIEGVPIVLGTATPSIESLHNVQQEKYRLVSLSQRATASELPQINLVDLKIHPPHPETFLSEPLLDRLQACLKKGEQALLFLNRRGYAAFLLCEDCGEVPSCPNCSLSLTYHRRPLALKCHYCGYVIPPVSSCEACGGIALKLMGIGTEKIEDHLKEHFPNLRLGRLDRDVVTSRFKTEEVLSQFGKGELDVLIGTQLVTKGHDFKRLSLVGILLADVTLHLPDFRASEKLFQLITQVAGRAGRHGLHGEVFVQTYRPEHFSISAAIEQDSKHFLVQELSFREECHYPPFRRLVLLRLSGNESERVEKASQVLGEKIHQIFSGQNGVEILGPTKATLERLRGKYRWQILLKVGAFGRVRKTLEDNLPQFESELSPGVQLSIDVDPFGIF
jgi:primosomal protein N' (replication factor Y)